MRIGDLVRERLEHSRHPEGDRISIEEFTVPFRKISCHKPFRTRMDGAGPFYDEAGRLIASVGLAVPPPWEVRESTVHQGEIRKEDSNRKRMKKIRAYIPLLIHQVSARAQLFPQAASTFSTKMIEGRLGPLSPLCSVSSQRRNLPRFFPCYL